jgi:hypothetical protein
MFACTVFTSPGCCRRFFLALAPAALEHSVASLCWLQLVQFLLLLAFARDLFWLWPLPRSNIALLRCAGSSLYSFYFSWLLPEIFFSSGPCRARTSRCFAVLAPAALWRKKEQTSMRRNASVCNRLGPPAGISWNRFGYQTASSVHC